MFFAGRGPAAQLTRRWVLRAAAGAGLAVATLPVLARPSQQTARPLVLTWKGYDRSELYAAYEQAYGAAPRFVTFASEDEALARVGDGLRPDVMHPCSYDLRRWREAGLLQPIEVSRLSHFGELWEGLLTIPETVHEGYRYFVPVDCGQASVLYRTDLVDPYDVEQESWDLLFNDSYAGRLAMYDTGQTLVDIAAMVLGYGQGTALDEEQLEAVRELLVEQRSALRFYWRDPAEMEHALASGEIVAAFAWNASVRRVSEMGVPVRFMEPREGRLTWVCGLVRHAQAAGDPAMAHAVIDAMLAPESGKALIETFGIGHANRHAYELVDADLLARLGMESPASLFARCIVPRQPEEPHRSRYLNLVNEVKAGLD